MNIRYLIVTFIWIAAIVLWVTLLIRWASAQGPYAPYDRDTQYPTYYQQEQLQLQREQNAILRRQYKSGNPTANYPLWDNLRKREPDVTDIIIQRQLEKTFNRDEE